ncbi:MAG: hypothetical protein KatS3mg054_1446 [Chloroflexus sp.]|uniref:DUF190 domain-containing protein n=1 Tax=Chloroflexus sp. TaxID=1904827 RepID=UPI0021DE6598|nr:DUF190 domain-containing protein [Chloroflexus sp.]GIV87417.1 MAG: hypothetical protein KatS3mg054_1446 [Chloroflexus sp.]GIV91170.1 MAG: hypothetical protein KatS3mg055_3688 [Chloroflexus sp.]
MAEPTVQRVRIYLNGEDSADGQPLYKVVVDELRQSGATGATVLQALTGFGPRRQMLPNAMRQPVVIEWVDNAVRIQRLLPLLSHLIGDALVTLEPVTIVQGVLRPAGPFSAAQLVSDLMQADAPVMDATAPLPDVLEPFVAGRVEVLAVVENETVIGTISLRELVWRAGLRVPPYLLSMLEPAERAAVLAPLQALTAGAITNREIRGVHTTMPITQALTRMIEWGYNQIPVLDPLGRLAGVFGQHEVLQAVAHRSESEEATGLELQVGMVMQAATARATLGQSLATALALLITTPGQSLFVVDGDRRIVGVLRLSKVLSNLQDDERTSLLTALQSTQRVQPTALPGARRTIDAFLEPPPPVLAINASLGAAARQLLTMNTERLPVVDSEGRLSGIIARGALVRALLQHE